MDWVYTVGTEKPQPIVVEPTKQKTGGFFSSLFSGLAGANTPQRTPTPLVTPAVTEADLLLINESNVVLTIFTAEVDVQLTKKMSAELHRSTKKNPPAKVKYQLIYVSSTISPFVIKPWLTMRRPEKTRTMPVRRRMKHNQKQLEVCSRVLELTWMGRFTLLTW